MTSMTSGCRCEPGWVPADIAQLSVALPWNLKNAAAIGLALRFADQQVEVLGHDDVAQHHEAVGLAGLFQKPQKQVAPPRCAQPRPALVTTASDEVQMAGTVIPLETLRHGLMLSGLPRNVCDGLHTRPLQTAQGAGHPSGVESAGGRGGAPG